MSTIKVLGPGCKNCERLTHLTEQALVSSAAASRSRRSPTTREIASYGVMSTPALVVDDQVLMAGRIPALSSLKDALAERLTETN